MIVKEVGELVADILPLSTSTPGPTGTTHLTLCDTNWSGQKTAYLLQLAVDVLDDEVQRYEVVPPWVKTRRRTD